MAVTLNTAISNPRASKVQKTNFKALQVSQISKNDSQARMFLVSVKKGIIQKTADNVRDLLLAINKTKDVGVKSYLEEAAYDVWGFKK